MGLPARAPENYKFACRKRIVAEHTFESFVARMIETGIATTASLIGCTIASASRVKRSVRKRQSKQYVCFWLPCKGQIVFNGKWTELQNNALDAEPPTASVLKSIRETWLSPPFVCPSFWHKFSAYRQSVSSTCTWAIAGDNFNESRVTRIGSRYVCLRDRRLLLL